MLPISLRPNGRRAVVVGGGNVAARKAKALAEAGFPILVVAERIDDRLREVVLENGGACEERSYDSSDLAGAAFVVAATNDESVNARVVADARHARVLVCDATLPDRGDFTMAATIRIGDLTISADSAGASPAFSRRIVREISERFGPEYGDAVSTLRRIRAHVKETFSREEGAEMLREIAERPVGELASMADTIVVCASRRSALATIQTRSIAALLAQRGVATTILGITTGGDRQTDRSIEQLGIANVFVAELESALRDRRADYAVHSCKDLPSTLASDMRIAAFSRREDPRDAFCSERYGTFDSLPAGAVVGTSSPRRRAQLGALRPDLRYETLRGNVDTRLRKLRDGRYDAIVLAMAGLIRLRQGATHVVPFAVEQLVPAVGQGCLAVETRAGDDELSGLVRAAVNDPASELCVRCERAALAALHAGCSAPIGIYAQLAGEVVIVDAAVQARPGAIVRHRLDARVEDVKAAEELGVAVAAELAALTLAQTGADR
jgi:hydroxymethylbilane synthase